MGWFQNFVNNSPHLFGEDSDFSESDSEHFICKSHSQTLHLCTDCPTRK